MHALVLMAALAATASPKIAPSPSRPTSPPVVAIAPSTGSAPTGHAPKASPRPLSPSPRPSHGPQTAHRKPHPEKHEHLYIHPHHRQRVDDDDLTPREVVKFFCGLDAEGARLEDGGLRMEINRLDAWDEEPGWDEVTVIRSFAVGDAESYGDFSHVEVRFSVIGTLTPDRLEPMPPVQTVVFHLERKGKVWQIESPLYEPHVFRSELLHQLSKGGTSAAVLKALAAAR